MKFIRLSAILVMLVGCIQGQDEAEVKTTTLTLATTTSTRDSGLLDELLPPFEKEAGVEVKVVAVGSGQALELGRRGDADVLLTHAPSAEKKFMAEGYGEKIQGVMHNDFVLVGPQADKAQIEGQASIIEAFRLISRSESPFISRGDQSGTHMKEMKIWKEVTIKPQGEWYIQAGAGMAEALRMASEKRAYTLSDRGTYLAQRDRLDLTIHSEGDPLLRNPYAVIVVNSKKHPGINHQAASQLMDYLLSPSAQQIISKFGIEKYGQPLFYSKEVSALASE